MKRGILLVAVASIFASGAGGVAGAKKPKSKAKVPADGWGVLAQQGHKTVLYTGELGEAPPLVVQTVDVSDVDGAKVAHIQVGEYDRWFAITDRGVWQVDDASADAVKKALAGPPLFAVGDTTHQDKDGNFERVSDDGTVCVGWENQSGECEDVCFNTTCFTPGVGLTEVDGNDAPEQAMWRADAPTCMPNGAYGDRHAADATSVTTCSGDRCRRFDAVAGTWSDAGAAPEAKPPPEPSPAPAFDVTVPPALGTADSGLVTADGVAVIVTHDAKGLVSLTSFDPASGKKLGHAKLPGDALGANLSMLGGLLEVDSSNCAGPCNRVDLYEPKKLKLRGTVGGKHPIDAMPAVAIGNLYAFVDSFGAEVDFHDGKTGKLKKRVSLGKVAPAFASMMPGSARGFATGDTLTVLYEPSGGGTGTATALVVSSKGKILQNAALPLCLDPALAPPP